MAKNKKLKKIAVESSNIGTKKIVSRENPESYMKKTPTWSFVIADLENQKWGFCTQQDCISDNIRKLKDFEGQTWSEILKATGGRTHGNNSHFINVSDLIVDAQKRWSQLKLEEYDQVFSLRLSGKHRLYGILENGIFKIVWFDKAHEIYPVNR